MVGVCDDSECFACCSGIPFVSERTSASTLILAIALCQDKKSRLGKTCMHPCNYPAASLPSCSRKTLSAWLAMAWSCVTVIIVVFSDRESACRSSTIF